MDDETEKAYLIFNQADVSLSKGQEAFDQGDYERALELWHQSLTHWRELIALGTPETLKAAQSSESELLGRLGILTAEVLNDYRRGQAFYGQASDGYRQLGYLEVAAQMSAGSAYSACKSGDLDEARRQLDQSLLLLVEIQEQQLERRPDLLNLIEGRLAWVAITLAPYAARRHENYDDMEKLYGAAFYLYLKSAQKEDARKVALHLATLLKMLYKYDQAREWVEGGLELSRQIGRPGLEADCLLELGLIDEAEGKRDEARKFYDQAFAAYRRNGDAAAETKARHAIANEIKSRSDILLIDGDRAAEAAQLLQEAAEMAVALQMPEAEEWAKALESRRAQSKEEQLAAFYEELDGLIGLENVKQRVREIVGYAQFQKMRQESGIPVSPIAEHMVFTGNPGTGKTTVARLLARMYGALDVLSAGHTVEADRSTLVGGYLGQTAQITKEVATGALGGVLFIDEAYALTPDGQPDSYGQEAINTLLKFMEDHRNNLIVIIAGYTDKMKRFIASNPGLKSRFTTYLHFDDYRPEDMVAIFETFCAREHYQLGAGAADKLLALFTDLYERRDETFGNARLVRNVFEKSTVNLARRSASLSTLSRDDLTLIRAEDVPERAALGSW